MLPEQFELAQKFRIPVRLQLAKFSYFTALWFHAAAQVLCYLTILFQYLQHLLIFSIIIVPRRFNKIHTEWIYLRRT